MYVLVNYLSETIGLFDDERTVERKSKNREIEYETVFKFDDFDEAAKAREFLKSSNYNAEIKSLTIPTFPSYRATKCLEMMNK
jgi:hypothetical protein